MASSETSKVKNQPQRVCLESWKMLPLAKPVTLQIASLY